MIDHPTRDAGFGVYVHWPFCLAKCPYCDFNSHVRGGVDQARFARSYAREIGHVAALVPDRTVTSIFFGGGTPSLMQPETLRAILAAIRKHWAIAPDAEITLEANPTSVEAGRFREFHAAGINRLSLGVQAMNDADLQKLGRMHTASEALAAVTTAASIFSRYSFDLIYARPGQTVAAWKAELGEAIAYAAEHLSLYQLTIEEGTRFHTLHRTGRLTVPDDDAARTLYDATQEVCDAHGLPRYEISNHARSGAESRHNLLYWRYGEYAGIGPGAHGRLVVPQGRVASAAEKRPEAWLDRVEKTGSGQTMDEPLTPAEQGDEFLLMGLRLCEGIDIERHVALAGHRLDGAMIDDLVREGLIARQGTRIAVTRQGFPILNAIIAALASSLSADGLRRGGDNTGRTAADFHHRQGAIVGAIGTETEHAVGPCKPG